MHSSEGAASDFFEDDEEDFNLGGPSKHLSGRFNCLFFNMCGYHS